MVRDAYFFFFFFNEKRMLTVKPSHLARTQTVSFNASPTPLESS